MRPKTMFLESLKRLLFVHSYVIAIFGFIIIEICGGVDMKPYGYRRPPGYLWNDPDAPGLETVVWVAVCLIGSRIFNDGRIFDYNETYLQIHYSIFGWRTGYSILLPWSKIKIISIGESQLTLGLDTGLDDKSIKVFGGSDAYWGILRRFMPDIERMYLRWMDISTYV
jgi:hypothetical protein